MGTIIPARSDISEAINIMREVAEWLIQTGKPMWRLEELTTETLLKHNNEEDFYMYHTDGEAASAMILKWHDPFFWPEVKKANPVLH